MNKFKEPYRIQIYDYEIDVAYEEFFRWRWLASRQKIFSFVCYREEVTYDIIRDFSNLVCQYSMVNYKGSFQWVNSVVVSKAVLACKKVDPAAIKFVKENLIVHNSATEIPMIYDLKNECLYYMDKLPLWGWIYNRFRTNYIKEHFDI